MAADKAPHWKQFERLAERIFAELLPFAQVTWNDHLLGQHSMRRRQIDVSIRAQVSGQPILSIVQAKDTSEAVDIGVVDAFASVVRDVRATKGILICRSGFDRTVYTYARSAGIEL